MEHSLHAFWHMAEYIADTLIFFVAGVVMAAKMFSRESHIEARDWTNLFVLYLAIHAVRGLIVFLSWPVLRRGYGVKWEEAVVLVM